MYPKAWQMSDDYNHSYIPKGALVTRYDNDHSQSRPDRGLNPEEISYTIVPDPHMFLIELHIAKMYPEYFAAQQACHQLSDLILEAFVTTVHPKLAHPSQIHLALFVQASALEGPGPASFIATLVKLRDVSVGQIPLEDIVVAGIFADCAQDALDSLWTRCLGWTSSDYLGSRILSDPSLVAMRKDRQQKQQKEEDEAAKAELEAQNTKKVRKSKIIRPSPSPSPQELERQMEHDIAVRYDRFAKKERGRLQRLMDQRDKSASARSSMLYARTPSVTRGRRRQRSDDDNDDNGLTEVDGGGEPNGGLWALFGRDKLDGRRTSVPGSLRDPFEFEEPNPEDKTAFWSLKRVFSRGSRSSI
ncbi:hypothetical protein BT63DRAFT_416167 [Microthyrium microscopicum]|uniref:Uncharacterized protein n=1 Tax=Microthyrium microscopicum TaxID=703497 RepID=A0A6A6U729_9PEZI|nr:hypothetical protein BT63DRAFT_416167 [Microthyrium microscopicum]